jgi:hypothetical protein
MVYASLSFELGSLAQRHAAPLLLDCLLTYFKSTIISELLKYHRSVGDKTRLKQRKRKAILRGHGLKLIYSHVGR